MPKYYTYYKAHKKTDTTVAIFAGVGGGHHLVASAIKEFQKEFNVIEFSNPGYKKNDDRNLFYTPYDLAKTFLDSIKDLSLKNLTVFGHCMGGMIAQEMALLEPNFVNKIILGSAHYGGQYRLEHHDYLHKELGYKKIEEYLFTSAFIKENPQEIKALKQDIIDNGLKRVDLIGQGYCGYAYSTMQKLKDIKQNTLIYHGAEDNTVLPKFAFQLHNAMPKSKLIIMEGAGHSPLIETPQIIQDIIDFIKSDEEFPEKDISNAFTQEELDKDNAFLIYCKEYDWTMKVVNHFNECKDEALLSALERLKLKIKKKCL